MTNDKLHRLHNNQIAFNKIVNAPITSLPLDVYPSIISYLSHPSNFVRTSRSIMNIWNEAHVKTKWFIQNAQSEWKFQLDPTHIVQREMSLSPVILFWNKYLTEPVANLIAKVLVTSNICLFGERKDDSRFNMRSEAMNFASKGFFEAVKLMMEPGLLKMRPPRVIDLALSAEQNYYSDDDSSGCNCRVCKNNEIYSEDSYCSSEEKVCHCPYCLVSDTDSDGMNSGTDSDMGSEVESNGEYCAGSLTEDEKPVLEANDNELKAAKDEAKSIDQLAALVGTSNAARNISGVLESYSLLDEKMNESIDEINASSIEEAGFFSGVKNISESNKGTLPELESANSLKNLTVGSNLEIPPESFVNMEKKKLVLPKIDSDNESMPSLNSFESKGIEVDNLNNLEDMSARRGYNYPTSTNMSAFNEIIVCNCSSCRIEYVSHDIDECMDSDCEDCAELFEYSSSVEQSLESECMCDSCVAQRLWEENQIMEEFDEESSEENMNIFGLVEDSEEDYEIDRYWAYPWEILFSIMENYSHEKHYRLLVWIKETFDNQFLKTNRSPSEFEPFENESLYTHILQRENISNILIIVKLLVEMNARPTRRELMFLKAEAIASEMGIGKSKGLLELFPKEWIRQLE